MTDLSTPDSLLALPTTELLERFAAAKLTPGAGSAAALLGAVAGSLVEAAARYAIKKREKEAEAPSFRERATVLLAEAGERSERLRQAVEGDAAAFTQYWESRATEDLERATDVPIGIARECVALAEIGLELYERGHRNARGEAGTAVLSALAGAEAALHTARLNLRPGGAAPGSEVRRAEIRGLRGQLLALRERSERVLTAEETA